MFKFILLLSLAVIVQCKLVSGAEVSIQFGGLMVNSTKQIVDFKKEWSDRSSKEFKQLKGIMDASCDKIVAGIGMFKDKVGKCHLKQVLDSDSKAYALMEICMPSDKLEFDTNLCPSMSLMNALQDGFLKSQVKADYKFYFLSQIFVPADEEVKTWDFFLSGLLADPQGKELDWNPDFATKTVECQIERNLTKWINTATQGQFVTSSKVSQISEQDDHAKVEMTLLATAQDQGQFKSRCLPSYYANWLAGALQQQKPKSGYELVDLGDLMCP